MSVLIILCHPAENSFNHQIAYSLRKGLESQKIPLTLIDLYKDNFSPVLTTEEYQRKMSMDSQVIRHIELVEKHSCLVFIHPDWWGGAPAMLKGWVERVFQPGMAYKYKGDDFLPKRHVSLLKGKKAGVFFTTNNSKGQSLNLIRQWSKNILDFCGISPYIIKGLYHFHDLSNQQKQLWLNEVQKNIVSLIKNKPL
ncbi:MAG: NAD(P)H-dependent oxidoreductase [Spirochaetales bacterium]|nr:NAD(P)H-dependent oxidoreductase [Spirochaetales bacterium]